MLRLFGGTHTRRVVGHHASLTIAAAPTAVVGTATRGHTSFTPPTAAPLSFKDVALGERGATRQVHSRPSRREPSLLSPLPVGNQRRGRGARSSVLTRSPTMDVRPASSSSGVPVAVPVEEAPVPSARAHHTSAAVSAVGEDASVYASSINKRLPARRHAHRPTRASETASSSPSHLAHRHMTEDSSYDPALVVHVDSANHRIHLNSIQKELVWAARQKEYHSVLHRIVSCLEGHQTPVEKASTLMALHDVVLRQRLRLRVDTYEDVFHVLYAVAEAGHVNTPLAGHASAMPSSDGKLDARWEEEVRGRAAMTAPLALPAEFATASAASSALLSEPAIARIWTMYRYLVDSGTNPSPRVLQYIMGILEHAARAHTTKYHRTPLPLLESKAHALLMDADRFRLTPTEYTINAYISLCDVFGVMHLAVARVTDYQTRHERQASPGMYARLLTGLVRNGHDEEAMAMVTTMNSVAMSVPLLNAVLQAARHSKDPMSVFSLYRAVLGGDGGGSDRRRGDHARLTPTIHTFSILIEVLVAQTQYGEELSFVLREMQRYRVKGNVLLLNKILRALLAASRLDEAASLCSAMRRGHVQVFDELAAQLEARGV